MPWPKPMVIVSNGPQREPGVSGRPISFSSICALSRKPIFLSHAFCRSLPSLSAIWAMPMFELSIITSAIEHGAERMGVVDEMTVGGQHIRAIHYLAGSGTVPESIAIARVNGLNVDPSSNTPSVARLNIWSGVAAPGTFGFIEGSEVIASTSPVWTSMTTAAARSPRSELSRPEARAAGPAGRRSRSTGQRLPASRRVGEIFVEGALGAGGAVAVDVGEAEHVRRERRLGVEPVGLALNGETGLAKCIDRLDQRRRGAAAKVEERLARPQHSRNTALRSAPASAWQASGQARACRR